MGRSPCCSKVGLKRGPWSSKEDTLLSDYIHKNGEGPWRSLPKEAGLLRCGKSCRLRWMNYLRPGIVRGNITEDEEDLILRMHALLGNRWSLIAGRLPGRTDNEIKNYWNTHLLKKLNDAGVHPVPHRDLPKKTKMEAGTKQQKIRVKKDNGGKLTSAAAVDKQDEGTPSPKTTVYLPKALRFSRSNSYDSLVSGTSSVAPAVEWPPVFEIEDEAAYGVLISGSGDGGGEDFLGGEYSCPPVVSHTDSMSDDAEMIEKLYDEYWQLL